MTGNYFFSSLFLLVSFTATAQSETEPNGSTSNATVMGASITGAINPAGDIDIFSFQVNQPGVLTMRVSNVPSNLALTIHMLDPDLLQWITVSSITAGNSVGFSWNACKMGKYYIRIFQPQNNFSASSYTVTASLNTDDVYECNNNFDEAKTIPVNQTVNAYINGEADRDYFLMDMPENGQLSLSIPSLPSNMRMVLYVYDFARTLIKKTSVPAVSGTPVSLTTAVAKGKHYIVVEDDNYNMSETRYVLNTLFSFSTGLTEFEREFGNHIKVSPNPSHGKFSVQIQTSTTLKPLQFTVYSSIGEALVSRTINGTGNSFSIDEPNLPAGTYLLNIRFKNGYINKIITITR